jgi:predicted acylesterase/phospholipase RssA
MENPEKDAGSVGNDAVCFTAGLQGAPFSAGTIHAYLVAHRPPPAVVAGVSMGAVSAAAMQRAYRDVQASAAQQQSGPEQNAARWRWFREYLRAISERPFDVFWNAIPDQSDFFADMEPIKDPSIPKDDEARRRLYLLVKTGRWIAGLPVSIRVLADLVVNLVRVLERYPKSRKAVSGLRIGWDLIQLVSRVVLHNCLSPKFFPEHKFPRSISASGKGGAFQRIPRPIFGWAVWLGLWVNFLSLLGLSAAALLLVLGKYVAGLSFMSRYGAQAWWLLGISASVLLLTWLIMVAIIFSPDRRRRLAAHVLNRIGLDRSLINDFHLRAKLNQLFDPDMLRDRPEPAPPTPLTEEPMPIVLVAAPLQTLFKGDKPLSARQLWAKPQAPLVDALMGAIAAPPFYEPFHLGSEEQLRWWLDPETMKQLELKKGGYKPLDLVDGGLIRQNPIPALFSYLRSNPRVARRLERNKKPALHVVYRVPIEGALGTDGPPKRESETDINNIVDVSILSLGLSQRRDTQLEVIQTNFISQLQSHIEADTGAQPEGRPVAIFADQIAPQEQVSFRNPLNPRREDIMKVVAAGCRRTLETLYRDEVEQLPSAAESVEEIDCSALIHGLRKGTHAPGELPGLPEVCRECSQRLSRSSSAKEMVTSVVGSSPEELGDAQQFYQSHKKLSGESPRLVFVANGGVFRGAFHIGMLGALAGFGIKPDLIVGTSVGTLIGGALGAMCAWEKKRFWRLGLLTSTFLHVDDRVALTRTLKAAARELGLRGRSVRLSPRQVRNMMRRGTRADAGFAASGAPPAVVDALSDLLLIPQRETQVIARTFLAGDITKATHLLLVQMKKKTLRRLDIEQAVIGTSLLAQVAEKLLTDGNVALRNARQPFNEVAYFGTTTNLKSQSPMLLGGYDRYKGSPYDYVEAALASSAFPAVFAPRLESAVFPGSGRTDTFFADGGMFDNLPFLPAIQVLSWAQCGYRQSRGAQLDSRDFLRKRHERPDLMLAGALDVLPESDPEAQGAFDTLAAICRRSGSLAHNVKIRSFEYGSEQIHKQLKVYLGQSGNGLETAVDPGDPPGISLADKVVDAAVLPVFPASADHLNGTFSFCASTGLDRERVQRSIANGCFETLRAFAEAEKGEGFAAETMRTLFAFKKFPRFSPRASGKPAGKNQCPYFKMEIAKEVRSMDCPFAVASQERGEKGLDHPDYPEAMGVHTTCINDPVHRGKLMKLIGKHRSAAEGQ